MIFCGMVGALFAGLILDYTKFFKGVAVTTYALAILSFIWFYEVITLICKEFLAVATLNLTYLFVQ